MARGPLESVDRLAGLAVGAAQVILAIWFLAPILATGPSPRRCSRLRAELPSPAPVAAYARSFYRVGLPQVFQFLENPMGPSVATPCNGGERLGTGRARRAVHCCGGRRCLRPAVDRHRVFDPRARVHRDECTRRGRRAPDVSRRGKPASQSVPGWCSTIRRWTSPSCTLPDSRFPHGPLLRAIRSAGIGVTLEHPGGALAVVPAAVRGRSSATRAVHGDRVVIELAADVQAGDSGGPFVTA